VVQFTQITYVVTSESERLVGDAFIKGEKTCPDATAQ